MLWFLPNLLAVSTFELLTTMITTKKSIYQFSTWLLGIIVLLSSCTGTQKTSEESTTEMPPAETKDLGMQIYSARDALKEDFAGTMAKVASIGYKYIEAFGLGTDGMIYGMTPAEYKKVVDSLGMTVLSVHSTYFTPEQADVMVKASQELGVKYHIVPYLQDDLRADYAAVAENFNKVGEKFKGSGVKFGYHNHAFEFEPTEDGSIPMEILIENTNPELVTFEADLYWVVKGGADPKELINKYPGRFALYHVKDADDSLNQTTVGTGIIDFESILKMKEVSGNENFFVEDERTDDPFANLQGALDYLNSIEY